PRCARRPGCHTRSGQHARIGSSAWRIPPDPGLVAPTLLLFHGQVKGPQVLPGAAERNRPCEGRIAGFASIPPHVLERNAWLREAAAELPEALNAPRTSCAMTGGRRGGISAP